MSQIFDVLLVLVTERVNSYSNVVEFSLPCYLVFIALCLTSFASLDHSVNRIDRFDSLDSLDMIVLVIFVSLWSSFYKKYMFQNRKSGNTDARKLNRKGRRCIIFFNRMHLPVFVKVIANRGHLFTKTAFFKIANHIVK